jgi:uncharacterized protein YjbI with pentapeptide repeats
MCNHGYTTKYAHLPRSIGKQCPYPELYKKAYSKEKLGEDEDAIPKLPIDKDGVCIFHSQNVEWKRENDFEGEFLKLISLIDADESHGFYDFVDFIFIGNERISKQGTDHHILCIANKEFRKMAYFSGSSFIDDIVFKDVNFTGGASFELTTFANSLSIKNTIINGVTFNNAKFTNLALFSNVDFLNYALFENAVFNGTGSGYVVKFIDSCFKGITDFSDTIFNPLEKEASMGFIRVVFEDYTDFKNSQFHNQVVFEDVSFEARTEFLDTLFETAESSARYRGFAVEFKRIEVKSKAELVFKSTDPLKKMFNHDIHMSFREDPTGIIMFENVNFSKFNLESRDRLNKLAKSGQVQIGSGCIKYRFQTDIRTISVNQGNTSLILEICHTFTNYFTSSNGLNLGFEIVERNKSEVSFFYFTDENISEESFMERLAKSEDQLLSLLSIRSVDQIIPLKKPSNSLPVSSKSNAMINVVDGISALLGTFFRVGARIAFGTWKENDTKALLNAIHFSNSDTDKPAHILHRILVDKYSDDSLFILNRKLNENLKLSTQTNHVGTYVNGDIVYKFEGNNTGQIVIASNPNRMHINQVVNNNENTIDFLKLADELSVLRQAMSQQAMEKEQHLAVGEVAKAEQAAIEKDKSKVLKHLKSAGGWALDVAKKVSVSIASEAIKQSMGMK